MKIALVAACDRNNYGDVLLPVLLENELRYNLKDSIDIQYYGLKKADLRKIGGKKTMPLCKIDDKTDVVIVAGGEVIGGTYTAMFMYFQNTKISQLAIRFLNHFFTTFTNKIAKIALHGKQSCPWHVLPCNENQKVFYNAIGCINLDSLSEKEKQELSCAIDQSTFFFCKR